MNFILAVYDTILCRGIPWKRKYSRTPLLFTTLSRSSLTLAILFFYLVPRAALDTKPAGTPSVAPVKPAPAVAPPKPAAVAAPVVPARGTSLVTPSGDAAVSPDPGKLMNIITLVRMFIIFICLCLRG